MVIFHPLATGKDNQGGICSCLTALLQGEKGISKI
jgi:hypothetical protein